MIWSMAVGIPEGDYDRRHVTSRRGGGFFRPLVLAMTSAETFFVHGE